MNSDSSLFTAFGLSGSKPVFIEIDTDSGEIKKFIELGITEQQAENIRLGAVYSDRHDAENSLYASLLIGQTSNYLRLTNDDVSQSVVSWSFQLEDQNQFPTETSLEFMIPDPNPEALWIGGIY